MTTPDEGGAGWYAALPRPLSRASALAGTPYAFALDDFSEQEPVVVAAPEPEPEPEPEPDPLPALLEAARAEGFAAGHAAGREEALRGIEAATAATLRDAASALALGVAEAREVAEATADAVARAALAAVLAALPTLAERCAEAEVIRFASALLPCLAGEPGVALRVAPDLVAPVAARFADQPRLEVLPDATLARGDARAAWRGGEAARHAEAARRAVMDAFAGFGLA
jgi:flagellar assembly protein FliH